MFKYALLVSLALVQQCAAVIVDIRELYNPELKQTIILCGDWHAFWKEKNKEQCQEFIPILKHYNAPVILEDDPRSDITEGRLDFLGQMHDSCKKGNFKLYTPDFRISYRNLSSLINDSRSIGNGTYSAIEKAWKNPVVRKMIHSMFHQAILENNAVIEELVAYYKAHPNKAHIDPLVNSIISEYHALRQEIENIYPKETTVDSFVNFLLDNTFWNRFSNKYTSLLGHKAISNSEHISSKIGDVACLLLEARIIKIINKNKTKPLLFVKAGAFHTINIALKLEKIGGYDQKALASRDDALTIHMRYLLKKGLTQKQILIAPELADYGINIAEFFKNCTTLPLKLCAKLMLILAPKNSTPTTSSTVLTPSITLGAKNTTMSFKQILVASLIGTGMFGFSRRLLNYQ